MKTRLLILACFTVVAILVTIGAYKAIQIHELLINFGKDSKLGSSGGGYPTYDGVWIFFVSGIILLASGITLWRKRK